VRDVEVDSARLEWSSGPDRLRRVRRGLDERRLAAVDGAARALESELMRRTGPDFRLVDLARLYADAERWAPGVLEGPFRGFVLPQAEAPLVDAAFHRHARYARDARDDV
jgi:hypothetical protein